MTRAWFIGNVHYILTYILMINLVILKSLPWRASSWEIDYEINSFEADECTNKENRFYVGRRCQTVLAYHWSMESVKKEEHDRDGRIFSLKKSISQLFFEKRRSFLSARKCNTSVTIFFTLLHNLCEFTLHTGHLCDRKHRRM